MRTFKIQAFVFFLQIMLPQNAQAEFFSFSKYKSIQKTQAGEEERITMVDYKDQTIAILKLSGRVSLITISRGQQLLKRIEFTAPENKALESDETENTTSYSVETFTPVHRKQLFSISGEHYLQETQEFDNKGSMILSYVELADKEKALQLVDDEVCQTSYVARGSVAGLLSNFDSTALAGNLTMPADGSCLTFPGGQSQIASLFESALETGISCLQQHNMDSVAATIVAVMSGQNPRGGTGRPVSLHCVETGQSNPLNPANRVGRSTRAEATPPGHRDFPAMNINLSDTEASFWQNQGPSVLFHEMVHWSGHSHGTCHDVSYFAQYCCFGDNASGLPANLQDGTLRGRALQTRRQERRQFIESACNLMEMDSPEELYTDAYLNAYIPFIQATVPRSAANDYISNALYNNYRTRLTRSLSYYRRDGRRIDRTRALSTMREIVALTSCDRHEHYNIPCESPPDQFSLTYAWAKVEAQRLITEYAIDWAQANPGGTLESDPQFQQLQTLASSFNRNMAVTTMNLPDGREVQSYNELLRLTGSYLIDRDLDNGATHSNGTTILSGITQLIGARTSGGPIPGSLDANIALKVTYCDYLKMVPNPERRQLERAVSCGTISR